MMEVCIYHMHWSQRPDIWDALDDLCTSSWGPLKEFLGLLSDHQSEISPIANALLFAGIGKFVSVYGKARHDELDGPSSFQVALEEIYSDERIQTLIMMAVNTQVDNIAGKIGD